MKPEAKFRSDIRKNVKGPHWQPIETWLIAGGVPDMNACWQGREIWIETKIHPRKPTDKQLNWARLRTNEGGRCWFLTKIPEKRGMPAMLVIRDWNNDFKWDSDYPIDWDAVRQVLFA